MPMNPGDVHVDRPFEKLREDLFQQCSRGTLPTGFSRLARHENLNCDQLADRLAAMAEKELADVPHNVVVDVEGFGVYVNQHGLIPPDRTAVPWDELNAQMNLRTLAESITIEEVEILREGVWNGDDYTAADLSEMVAAFDQVGFEPPVKLGHADEQKLLQADGLPAAGWVTKLKVVGDRLVATLRDVPSKIAKLISLGGYGQRSAEVFFNYRGAGDGKTYPRVLKALSLLGIDVPAVKGLSPLDSYLSLYGDQGDDIHVAGIELPDSDGGSEVVTENTPTPPAVTIEDLKKLTDTVAELKVANDSKDEKIAKLTSAVEVERTSRLSEEVIGFTTRMNRAGKLTPAEEPLVRLILEAADRSTVRKYTDGKDEVETTAFAAVKKLIEGRPEVFEISSSARTSTGDARRRRTNRDDEKTTLYTEPDGTEVVFDEVAAGKAQDEALKAGKPSQEAARLYKEAGLAAGRKGGRS